LKDDRMKDVGGVKWWRCRHGMLELNASTSDGRCSRWEDVTCCSMSGVSV
jgi:hypothetical protein